MKEMGEKIKAARKKAGMTQQEAADNIGVTKMTLIRYEQGVRNPSLETSIKIADVLDVPLSAILPDGYAKAIKDGMTMNEYQRLAARTINIKLRPEQQLHHALHGMASEVGEIHGLFQKHFQGHKFDPVHLKKELGDLLWMIAECCTAMDWTLDKVAQANIDKLRERYPEGFSEERSLHRKEGDI